MLSSMTGFGAARREGEDLSVRCEVRSVNGRFLKTSMRLPSILGARETEVESLVRKAIRRGSVTLSLELRQGRPDAVVSVNEDVVRAYQAVFRRLGISEEPLATRPGVLGQPKEELGDPEWRLVEATVTQALAELTAMRRREGEALGKSLEGILERLQAVIAAVRSRAPAVVLEHKHRLEERLQKLLAGSAVPLDAQLVAREVALFADRCDITEELDRLASHLQQFRGLLAGPDEAGRTLDFLAQELLREVNTIGSKSQDAQLAQAVIQMKSEVERLKEQVANLE